MLGHRPSWYWKLMWTVTSPALLIALFIFYIINYIRGGTPTYQAWDKEQVWLFSCPLLMLCTYCISFSKLVQMCACTGVKLGSSNPEPSSASWYPNHNRSASSFSVSHHIQGCQISHSWCETLAFSFCFMLSHHPNKCHSI